MQLVDFFKTLTLHPKNAQELKGLILQLAIQGKLTANWRKENPDIEPATILLEKVKEEKTKLIKEKKIKKESPLLDITKEEIPFKLNKSWIWCRLQDIEYTLGDGIHGTPEYIENGEYYFINGNNLTDGIIEIKSNTKTVSKEQFLKHKRNLNDSTILVSINGTIGNTAFYNDEKVILGKSACYFNLLNGIDKHYIRQLIKTTYFLKYAFSSASGTTIKNVSLKTMRSFLVPLPPLEEQKEIVRVVEILFKEVEQLEQLTVERNAIKDDYVTSALQQLTTQNASKEWQTIAPYFKDFFTEKSTIKKLRETVLQLAVQGKLTADWRSCHPELVSGSNHASELLRRIQKEKAQLIKDKKIKKESPLPAITVAEIPYELPEGWVWTCLGNLGLSQTGTTPPTKDPENYGTFIPFLGPADITNNSMKYPIDGLSEVGLKKGRLIKSNSLMMVCIGGSMGKCNVNTKDVSCNQQINVLTPLLSPVDYIKIICQSPYFQIEVWDRSTGSATPMINKNKWLQIPIALPPLEEQKAIVEKVTALMDLCDTLEEQITAQKEVLESWMQSVVREVFENNKERKYE